MVASLPLRHLPSTTAELFNNIPQSCSSISSCSLILTPYSLLRQILPSADIHSSISYLSSRNSNSYTSTYCMYGRIHFLLRVSFPSVRLREYWSIVQLVSLPKWVLLYLLLDQNIQKRWALSTPFTMAVIGKVYDHKHTHELLKRHNWASRNPGVILVFCIVFLVVLGFFTLFIYRRMLRRNAEKQAFTG